jgi:choline dehydrogenase-like flavoprotein
MSDEARPFDVIVVGSGAAGGWVAKECAERGLNVLVLEAGRALDPARDFPPPADGAGSRVSILNRALATLRGQSVQARCMSFGPLTAHLFLNDRKNPYRTAPGTRFNWYRARQQGGRLHLWGRNALRLSDHDLKAADRDGFGDTWPLGYADLAPWYARVEQFLGVRGQPAGIENLPDGDYSGPHPLTEAERALMAQMADKWPDRPATTCRIIHHMQGRQVPTLAAAMATGRTEIRTNAIAARVETDAHTGLATGVTYIDAATRQQVTVNCRAVALCASTIETVRLLHLSKAPRHRDGLGNSSGNLGRYLSDHLMVFRAGTMAQIEGMGADHDPYDFGQQSGIYVPSFRNRAGPDGVGFLRGYSLLGSVGRLSPGWFFMAIGEVLPRADNRVTLDPLKRDAWGLPVAHINLTHGDNEHAMIADMKATLADLSRSFGLADDLLGREGLISRLVYRFAGPMVYTADGALIPGSSIHETGGACMGTDPARQVTDPNNRLYDAPNVWVSDSAAFPTNPFHNPGLTIMALSARAGADIAQRLGQGAAKTRPLNGAT